MQRWVLPAFLLCVTIFAVPSLYADAWTAHENTYIPQSSALWAEVLPAEDRDNGHTITWGPNNAVRFYPSGIWNIPQEGDDRCWLYSSPSHVVWWNGVFNGASDKVYIQLRACDSNDGWADVYLDGSLAFSYDSHNDAGYKDVLIEGTGLSNIAHTVQIQTRLLYNGDLSIDYVAYPVPEPAGFGVLGLAALAALARKRT